MALLPDDFSIETERCRLRPPAEADFPYIYEASHTPGFNDGMPWEPPETLEELEGPLERGRKGWREGTAYNFAIEGKESGEFYGRISIRKSEGQGMWNIGFWMHPAHQGKGYVTESARAILRLGFETLGARSIEACYAHWNERSGRILRAIGMRQVGYLEQGFQKKGEWVAEYLMQCDRPENAVDG